MIRLRYCVRASRPVLTLLLALALVLPLPAAFAVQAATRVVDSTGDGAAVASHCTDMIAGNCTLRDALAAAVANDTITFSLGGGAHTITLTSGTLAVNKALTISGPGAGLLTVSGNNAVRVMTVGGTLQAYVVTISGLTITGGRDPRVGGGLYTQADVRLNDCVITGNTVVANANDLNGGAGIVNDLTLTLNRTQVTNNRIMTGSGSGSRRGAGIYNYENGYSTVRLTLNDSTVSGNANMAVAGDGGGIANINAAQTVLNRSHVDTNTATGYGGGIYLVGGVLTLVDSTASGNMSSDRGGGIYVASGTATLTHSVASRNGGTLGGGVYVAGGTATLDRTTVDTNTASGEAVVGSSGGGGIFVAGGTTTLTNSTVRGNSSPRFGGGIVAAGGATMLTNTTVSSNTGTLGGGLYSESSLALANVTVSGNNADSGSGVYSRNAFNGNGTTLTNTTLTGNSATTNGGGFVLDGGIMSITRTIVAANTASTAPDFQGAGAGIADSGYNLVGSPNGNTFVNGVNNNIVGTSTTPLNPLLAPLAENGYPTATHLPLPGSLAIDGGGATCPPGILRDQRGVNRPFGAACDIGAVEVAIINAFPTPRAAATRVAAATTTPLPQPTPSRHAVPTPIPPTPTPLPAPPRR